VARIDAHNLKRDVPSRLCYLGAVLHTRPENHGSTRSPLQVGAELYGHQGKESDAEILCLMLETLKIAGVNNVHVDLGHVGIYQGLVKQAGLSGAQETVLFDVLQRKAGSELQELIKTWSVPEKTGNMFMFLINANGDASVFREAGRHLATANAKVKNCLKELQSVAELVKKRIPDAPLYFDLAELRGYHYHTGIVFAAYVPGTGQGIAFGGRYDGIGLAFGRARPATGFSTDIKTLLALSSLTYKEQQGIFAPCKNDPALLKMIDKLRDKGEVVITELPGQKGNAKDMGCDRKLVRKAGTWKVVKL
jgi:ATP phosphoribosyltransferase regulatory subunit